MTGKHTTLVDFVAKGSTPDEWKMVLVEEGPWTGSIEVQLERVQGRLYGCVDAAIDGQLASQFPESNGRRIVIQMDCYNLPRTEVGSFFNKFSRGIFSILDYKRALKDNPFVQGISFEINFDPVK